MVQLFFAGEAKNLTLANRPDIDPSFLMALFSQIHIGLAPVQALLTKNSSVFERRPPNEKGTRPVRSQKCPSDRSVLPPPISCGVLLEISSVPVELLPESAFATSDAIVIIHILTEIISKGSEPCAVL